jgi:hypothetical protein
MGRGQGLIDCGLGLIEGIQEFLDRVEDPSARDIIRLDLF